MKTSHILTIETEANPFNIRTSMRFTIQSQNKNLNNLM
jgi:hypothetical protein